MSSGTKTISHRPARLAAAVMAVLTGMLLGLVAVLPATATPPFALPEQITDHIGAVEGETATIRAALDDLEVEHGVRVWVVFVDSFDGTDPQTWAEETFTATRLGPKDYLLAVAMGDREYGYVVDDAFVLSDAALTRVATAAERHLAETPARAVTTAAAELADELTGGSTSGFLVPAVAILVVVIYVAVAARGSRRPATGQDGADDFFGQRRDYDQERWTKQRFPGGSSGFSWFGGSHDTRSSHGGWGGGSSGGGGGTRGGSGSF